MSYEQDMTIDETALDIECLEQADLTLKYARLYAEAKRDVEQAEEKVKIVRSELIRDANEDPDDCLGDGVKPTGPNVEAYYRTHEDHIAAKDELINLQYELTMIEGAKNGIAFTRKAMLEALIQLHAQQYFAGPKMPRDLSFEAQKRHKDKKSQTGIAGKMKRTRTK